MPPPLATATNDGPEELMDVTAEQVKKQASEFFLCTLPGALKPVALRAPLLPLPRRRRARSRPIARGNGRSGDSTERRERRDTNGTTLSSPLLARVTQAVPYPPRRLLHATPRFRLSLTSRDARPRDTPFSTAQSEAPG
eukprot:363291-Chlamydomonas_euryale.AAC.12